MVSTHLKNISQNGNLPQLGMKIKNIWNHHLVLLIKGIEETEILAHTSWRIDRPVSAPSGPSPQTTPRWVWHRDEAGKADAIPGSVRTWVLFVVVVVLATSKLANHVGSLKEFFCTSVRLWKKKCLEKDPDAQPPTIYHLKSQLCCLTSGSGC